MYKIETIYKANTVKEAVATLQTTKDVRIIAGGTDLLVDLRQEGTKECTLLSLQNVDELKGIMRLDDGTIKIGALTTFSDIIENPIIQEYLPTLSEAVATIGGPQIRNVATIGGNICSGSTTADSAPTLLLYDAIVEVIGVKGIRQIPLESFYRGHRNVDLEHAEIVASIMIKQDHYEKQSGIYIKYGMRKAMDIAILGCAVSCKLDEKQSMFEEVRIALGVAGPTPVRCKGAEKQLQGKPLTKQTVQLAGELVLKEARPIDCWRASKALRLHLCKVLTMTALEETIKKAGGIVSD